MPAKKQCPEYYKRYRLANLESIKARSKVYRDSKRGLNVEEKRKYHREWRRKWWIENREKARAITREYYKNNRLRRIAQTRASTERHKDAIKTRTRARYKRNRDQILSRQTEIRNANKPRFAAYHRRYNQKHRIKVNARKAKYARERRKVDPGYRLKANCRLRIRNALKGLEGAHKSAKTLKLLGCSTEFFKCYLEHQFSPEMSWENYGSFWQVDHVMPVSKFNLFTPEGQRNAFHYSNCKPLESIKNASKGARMPPSHQPLLI